MNILKSFMVDLFYFFILLMMIYCVSEGMDFIINWVAPQ